MVFVGTARLRQHAPPVRGPALAAHRTARRPVLVHPHHHRPHPVVYVFGVLMVAGWIVGGVVMLPRLVDSVGYLAGAVGSLFVGLIFEGGALLAVFILLRPRLARLRDRGRGH
jgi:hypothetical protein